MAEEERDRLLSASCTNDDDDDADIKHTHTHSKLASADVASSIKDVHINENRQSKAAGLFRRCSSASRSHRRVVNRDSDSDEDFIGPPVPSANNDQPQPSTPTDSHSGSEIGPPAPAGVMLQNIEQGTIEKHESSDEEIGPQLPDAAAPASRRDDNESLEDRVAGDDDDSDADDDGNEEVTICTFILCI